MTFSINSGKKYKFGDFDIKVADAVYKDQDITEIKNISNKLLKNQTYSPETINKLNRQVTSYLESKKYSNFELDAQELKKNEDFINIVLALNVGQKVLINKININGNTITEEKTIRDNILLAEGDYLNSTKIKKSVDNIKSKQYFSKVDFKIEDSDKKNFKDFNLFVKEQPTGNISAGVGYGTNGGLFEASINERNFLGQGINLNFTGRLSTEAIRGDFSYVDPNYVRTTYGNFYDVCEAYATLGFAKSEDGLGVESKSIRNFTLGFKLNEEKIAFSKVDSINFKSLILHSLNTLLSKLQFLNILFITLINAFL